MSIPDATLCFRLMDEYGMLPNIRRHSVTVARAALEILDGFVENQAMQMEIPDRELIIAGALLHPA
jgi:uncharacterized protein